MNTSPGSLSLTRKHAQHAPFSDDGTTTRHGKALAMAHGINLHSPAATSMSRHKRRRQTIINLAWATVVIALVTWAWLAAWRVLV
jgi:hypothetical protein